mgnify:CR=1 FL=1
MVPGALLHVAIIPGVPDEIKPLLPDRIVAVVVVLCAFVALPALRVILTREDMVIRVQQANGLRAQLRETD